MSKNSFLRLVLIFSLFVALGFGVGYLIGLLIKTNMAVFPWWYILVFIISFYLSLVLHTFFHELGHMACAKIRGWKFISFMLFGIVLTKKDKGFRFSRYKIPGALGQCLMIPPEEGDTDFGIALYNAGGVAMNFLLLLTAIIAFILGKDIFPGYIILFLVTFICVGAFMMLINAIPLKISGLPNDGMNIVSLGKDKFSSEIFLCSMRAVAAMQKGCRISEFLDRYITEDVKIDYSNTIHVMALSFDYSRALDLKDFDKAYSLMDGINAHLYLLPKIYRLEFGMENVFLSLVRGCSDTEIDKLLDDETKKYMEGVASLRPSGLRVRYAIALLYEKDMEKAERIYGLFQKMCSKYYLPGEALSEKQLLDYLLSNAKS